MPRTAAGERIQVGEVDVDAGMVWVGDPCYVLGAGASQAPKDWAEFCERVSRPENWRAGLGGLASEPLGGGIGLAVSSGYGDGTYPVSVTVTGDGRVASLTIEFIHNDEYDEYDDYDEYAHDRQVWADLA